MGLEDIVNQLEKATKEAFKERYLDTLGAMMPQGSEPRERLKVKLEAELVQLKHDLEVYSKQPPQDTYDNSPATKSYKDICYDLGRQIKEKEDYFSSLL